MEPVEVKHEIRQGINDKYFAAWEDHNKKFLNRLIPSINKQLELSANKFGYSLYDYRNLSASPLLGKH